MKLTRYEQETLINFNAQDQMATLYTRDPAIMRKVDALVIGYPEIYKCIAKSDIDKTYEMPKSAISYRKPRRLSEEQKNKAKERMAKSIRPKYDHKFGCKFWDKYLEKMRKVVYNVSTRI